MTSTIRVDNFGPSAGGTTYSARGIAKAWVNFDGTGTIAARDSENVSSLTDNATGQYTINFSNAFGAADYAMVGVCKGVPGTSQGSFSENHDATRGASLINVLCSNNTTGGSFDSSQVNVATLGDLA